MISIRESKFIKSLQLKKFRKLEKRFLVEGAKNVLELLNSDLNVDKLFATEEFLTKHQNLFHTNKVEFSTVKESDLKKVGNFLTNNAAIAIAEIPELGDLDYGQSILAFDRIKDPGNLGTVIRIADWYGFDAIVCSPDSVDCYNAKVVSATMGSFARVKVHYLDLNEIVQYSSHIYSMVLGGESMHTLEFKKPATFLFGNESEGLSDDLIKLSNAKVTIPGFGKAESLNVGVSTAVLCDNFRRLTQ
ncbi:MAG: RNA methyltransferase [Reichenbachiella sp.]